MLLALAVGWFSEDRVPHNHPEISHGGYMAGYSGTCFCGSVQLTVEGQPEVMGYCHCNSCRKWSAAPVNAFSLWQRDAVKITRGAERIATFNLTPGSYRKWCMTCGGHLYTEHPGIGLVDIYAATIPAMAFRPGLHLYYAAPLLPMRDGLPKFREVPKEVGGSGETIPE